LKEEIKSKNTLEVEIEEMKESTSEINSILLNLKDYKECEDVEWISSLKENIIHCKKELKQMKYNISQESVEINELKTEINIESIEKDQAFRERNKTIKSDLYSIDSKIEDSNEKIKELTSQRFNKFHENCQRLNDSLTYIFQNLNPSSNCYLSYSEDKNSAFEQGVVIFCKTEGTWKQFSNLSGGQQAIAACALSLSFQFISPCPIFFYDEIDASLDTSNTEKVAKLLKKMDNQFICISLRPTMYELSSTLIGVYVCQNTSRTICKKF
jgi:chromosome segregation ATPase